MDGKINVDEFDNIWVGSPMKLYNEWDFQRMDKSSRIIVLIFKLVIS